MRLPYPIVPLAGDNGIMVLSFEFQISGCGSFALTLCHSAALHLCFKGVYP